MSSLTSAASRRVRHNRLAQERIDDGRESLTAYDLRLHGARYRLAARVEQRGVALDLGCGSGYGGEILSRSDVRLVGLDRNASTPRGSRSSPYVGIIRGEGLHLPFQNGAFTTVVMLEVIEHLDSPSRLLSEVYRVLSPDGVLILSTPNRNGLTKLLLKTIGWRNPFHLHEYNWEEMLRLLDAGFEVLDCRGLDFFKFGIESSLSRSEFLSRVFVDDLARIAPRVSSTMFFVCRKQRPGWVKNRR